MLVCAATVLLYGCYIFYQSWLVDVVLEVGYNELIWLIVFPFFSLAGGMNRSKDNAAMQSEFSFFDLQSETSTLLEGPCLVEEQFGYMSGNAFLYKLEEEVLVSLRERRKFQILVIQIENFREYQRLFGADHAQVILNVVAQAFLEFTADSKAQIGEAVLAGILAAPEHEAIVEAQERLNEQFYELLLNRPRREATVKLKLKYGIAECPTDGIEASVLMEKARNELSWNGI
jgi:GGDEF domain-containing protein